MKKIVITLAILLFNILSLHAQTCIGTTGLKHGRGLFSYLSYTSDHQIIAGGTYSTATQPYFAMDGDTLYPNPGDVLTAFAAILDTNFNLIRMFNVVGFDYAGGPFTPTRIYDMTVDDNKNIYFVGGYAQDTLIAGNDTVKGDGYLECLIAGVDSLGNHIFLKSFGSSSWWTSYVYSDKITAIDCDHAGNLYLTGTFGGSYFKVNSDSIANLSYVGVNDKVHIFTLSLTPTGQTRWLKGCGVQNYDDLSLSIAVDDSGNVSICGSTEASNANFIFGGTTYHYKTSPNAFQGYVASYDSVGNERWFFPLDSYNGNGDVSGYDVAMDANGNTYAMGFFEGYSIFNGDTVRPIYGFTSSFLVKINKLGVKQFVKTGRIDTFYPFPGKIDLKDDKVFITGQTYTNQLWFDQLGVCCSNDVYFAMYDTSGVLQWLKSGQTAGSSNLYSSSIAIGNNGTAYGAGAANGGNVTFLPQTFNASSAGEYYLTKWSLLNNAGLSVTIQNNSGSDTVNCGNSLQLQALVSPATPAPQYYWYAATDTFTFSFPGANVTASPKVNTLYIASAYVNGCVATDSIVIYSTPPTLDLGSDLNICSGDTVQLSATQYANAKYLWTPSGSGFSSDTIYNPTIIPATTAYYYCNININDCRNRDSIFVFVNPLPLANFAYTPGFLTIDVTSLSDPSAQYTWDFGDGTAQQNGYTAQHSYAATGTYSICCYMQALCGADSICKTVTITNVGIGENSKNDILVINREEEWEIKSTSTIGNYSLINSLGQNMMSGNVNSEKLIISKGPLPAGIYILKITSEIGERVVRVRR
ncbi:MAG: PKD domain-containing protein [Bacteroidota bacterium]